jgi:hypothetical protein
VREKNFVVYFLSSYTRALFCSIQFLTFFLLEWIHINICVCICTYVIKRKLKYYSQHHVLMKGGKFMGAYFYTIILFVFPFFCYVFTSLEFHFIEALIHHLICFPLTSFSHSNQIASLHYWLHGKHSKKSCMI